MIDQKLMDYFKFDQADLYANENGQFTDKQKERLFEEDKSNRDWSRIGGIVLFFIGAIGIWGALLAGIGDQDPGFRIGFGIGFGVIWPLIWGRVGVTLIKNSFSKHEFKLARVQGQVNIVREESYSSEHHTTRVYHELHIGGKEFDVEDDLADVMMQGDEYILYYSADSDEILSVELVREAK